MLTFGSAKIEIFCDTYSSVVTYMGMRDIQTNKQNWSICEFNYPICDRFSRQILRDIF